MNHQPFEDWLFGDRDRSENPLNPQEKAALQEHLENCAACRSLAEAWQTAESHLRSAETVAPQPGFTLRWHKRFEADRQRLQRRQSLAMLGFSIAAMVTLIGSLAILSWPVLQSPSLLLWTWFYRFLAVVSIFGTAQDFLLSILHTASGTISPVLWVLIAGFLSEIAVLWVVIFRLLTLPRSTTK
jgi:hypothetical protein